MAQRGMESGEEARHQIFVKADEVDPGTTISSPSKQLPLSALTPRDAPDSSSDRPKAPVRPSLRRDGSAAPPPPPSQPPPAPPLQSSQEDLTDSLSLPQLRQLVNQFPKIEQRAYAFQYADAQDFVDEINEWFHYSEQDRQYLLNSRDVFEQNWRLFYQSRSNATKFPSDTDDTAWLDVADEVREEFIATLLKELTKSDVQLRIEALACAAYITCGVWSITAGLEPRKNDEGEDHDNNTESDLPASVQVAWMHKGADLLVDSGIIPVLHSCLQNVLKAPDVSGFTSSNVQQLDDLVLGEVEYLETVLAFTSLYIIVESARSRPGSPLACKIRDTLLDLKPNLLVFLVAVISRLRWDESCNIPLTQALQLFWKCVLLIFGDTKVALEHAKGILNPRLEKFSATAPHPVLTASPLDYHLFRQEITSKYPAYNPPLPLVPLELEHKSMLPPLPHHPMKPDAIDGAVPGYGANGANGGRSIMHQPVHIATPAPSPPPSPVGPGGKTGKKQNYQTNQNFPFLYPPLDESSNKIGGKGETDIQDAVGKRWEGSDIPASIIEAGDLFASRMRMTRAMRQLWMERDLFMKYDRGWRGSTASHKDDDQDPEGEDVKVDKVSALDKEDEAKVSQHPELRSHMEAVEEFFHQALPNLQSLVIVMMKVMLRNVQDIALQNGNLQENNQTGGLNRTKSNANIAQNQNVPMLTQLLHPNDLSIEDLDAIRSREISQKAVCGSIFLLLKWCKLSHVLKFEYLTQLLLDSNYLQLTLKYFAHQNVDDLVAVRYDRDDLSFFHFCHVNSDHPPLSPTSPRPASQLSSADEAVPPPIMRHRRSPTTTSELSRVASPGQIDGSSSEMASIEPTNGRPLVDELGNPLAPLPTTPITDFSFRQFQTSIHLLRVLQKVTRSKAHRITLLVQFKSSQILRRILKIPDDTLRLYVLKLYKSQVPYQGRKWRQGNMKVITAIYLHCRPELRDEWLAGMHDSAVESEIEEALPLEWALRGLTYWWQKRTYPDVMRMKGKNEVEEGGQEIDDDERDFFQRELDNIGWGIAGLSVGEDVAFGEEAPGANGVGVNGEQWESASHMNADEAYQA